MKKIRTTLLVLAAVFAGFPAAEAKIVSRTVEYASGGQVLEGFVAFPDGPSKKPGIVIVHDWKGVGPYVKARAEKLAKMGYVAFVADIYGKGIRPATAEEAKKISDSFKANRPLLRDRVRAAWDELRKFPGVDASRTAAIGYCFGGTTVLELARSGTPVNGVVSFHGGLGSPKPEDAKAVKAKILVLHGADDPFVPADEVAGFEKEMREAKVDWQLVKYSGAVHSFTNPDAGNDPSKGQAYQAAADKRSWRATEDFFAELFLAR